MTHRETQPTPIDTSQEQPLVQWWEIQRIDRHTIRFRSRYPGMRAGTVQNNHFIGNPDVYRWWKPSTWWTRRSITLRFEDNTDPIPPAARHRDDFDLGDSDHARRVRFRRADPEGEGAA